jgi:DNA-binding response OmpR family regulator
MRSWWDTMPSAFRVARDSDGFPAAFQCLHERVGRVVSRAALLRDVWGYDWSGGSNIVEVVISALRRKLGDNAGSLQTVRGAGYRFTAPP